MISLCEGSPCVECRDPITQERPGHFTKGGVIHARCDLEALALIRLGELRKKAYDYSRKLFSQHLYHEGHPGGVVYKECELCGREVERFTRALSVRTEMKGFERG